MKPPCESVVRSYLKTLRTAVIHQLRTFYDFKQQDIADALDLTQAAISQALSRSVPPEDPVEMSLYEIIHPIASDIALLINSHRDDLKNHQLKMEILQKTCYLCKDLRLVGGACCGLHRIEVPYLKELDCKICSQYQLEIEDEVDERTEILSRLRLMGEKLTILQDLARLIPEVQSNLLSRKENARTPKDVAAFPGRIIKIKNQVRILSDPEFGASNYLSRVFLAVYSQFPTISCCICLRYDHAIEEALNNLGLSVVKLQFSENIDVGSPSLTEKIIKLLEVEKSSALDALINLGGHGTEPLTYVFAADLDSLYERIEQLLSQYS